MPNRGFSSTRLRNDVDPVLLLQRLGSCLGLSVPSDPHAVVKMPFPDVNSPTFREEYLLKEVLRKYPGFELGIDTRQVAVQGLLDQEATNRLTNERLQSGASGVKTGVMEVFSSASRKVASILGTFRWDWFADGLRFGPGATTRLGVENANLIGKLSGVPHVTLAAYDLAYEVLRSSPCWVYNVSPSISANTVLKVENFDKVTCVPKNAETDRTIGIQPDINVLLQLAVAYQMRRKLHPWGVNLNDQTINQRLARLASRDGKLATVDLRGASNSVVCELVWRMVGDHPTDQSPCDPMWFKVLDALRTPSGRLEDGTFIAYEMFSSMGNGFTFELESMVFWTLTMATCEFLGVDTDHVSVYGDDIICPCSIVPLLRDVLSYAGFAFNEDKSFYLANEGPNFRESCGEHYLSGKDVTPFYVTDTFDVPTVILLMNNIVRWGSCAGWGVDGRLKEVYDWLGSHLPERALKSAIPFGEDDDGLIKNFDEACPSVRYSGKIRTRVKVKDEVPSNGTENHFMTVPWRLDAQRLGYNCTTCVEHSRTRSVEGQPGLLAWLYTKSYRVFKWPTPGGQPLAGRRGVHPKLRWLDVNVLPEPSEGYKVPSVKVELKYSRRIVTSWDSPGPWVFPDPKVFYPMIPYTAPKVVEEAKAANRAPDHRDTRAKINPRSEDGFGLWKEMLQLERPRPHVIHLNYVHCLWGTQQPYVLPVFARMPYV
jgi:hypothetical protein